MNKDFFILRLKSVSKQTWLLALIVAVGIFFRTYNFHDWLRFNADQGRDSQLVSSVVDGKESLPLLGPKAGGTEFKLGPAFYYFEIASAKVFGNAPDKMAYPDLVTSILCIPLLFFFLRKYFDKKIALSGAAIFAVSNYAVRYARFAWNPNSTPFWTILALYAIHEVISQKNNRKYLWAIVAGIAIGIGVQLHTTLLLFLPITTILVFGYLIVKKEKIFKYFLILFAVSIFLNIPQIMHEYSSKGENVKAFFGGVKTKQEKNTFFENIKRDSSCWVQGSVAITSGYEISDTCSYKPQKHKDDLVAFSMGLPIVLGGIILGLWFLFKEKDVDCKRFLALLYVFMGVAFFVFIPMAFELSLRFFLALIFVPFLLLGFWAKLFVEKLRDRRAVVLVVMVSVLMLTNIFYLKKSYAVFANYEKKGGGTVDVIILKEAEFFADFIATHSDGEKESFVAGNDKFLFKAFKSIKYLEERQVPTKLSQVDKYSSLPAKYFYISRAGKKEKLLGDASITVTDHKAFGNFTILLVTKNAPVQ